MDSPDQFAKFNEQQLQYSEQRDQLSSSPLAMESQPSFRASNGYLPMPKSYNMPMISNRTQKTNVNNLSRAYTPDKHLNPMVTNRTQNVEFD